MSDAEDIFGPVISSYTRAQAVEDGDLIDVDDTDAGRLFKFPTVVTSAVWAEIERGKGKVDATRDARLWDVCYMAGHGPHRAMSESRRAFKVIVGRRTLLLWADCGPGDNGEPVVTIGFPEDF